MKALLLAFHILFLAVAAFAADETVTYRVTGLFSPGRESDLRTTLESLRDVRLVSVDFEHAEATFTFDPAVAFQGVDRDHLLERFDEKLRSASNNTFGIRPLFATPRDQLTRIEIPVFGLDCKACCLAAYEAIFKIEGVAQATASFKDRRVTALIDPAKTDVEALKAALKKKEVRLEAP